MNTMLRVLQAQQAAISRLANGGVQRGDFALVGQRLSETTGAHINLGLTQEDYDFEAQCSGTENNGFIFGAAFSFNKGSYLFHRDVNAWFAASTATAVNIGTRTGGFDTIVKSGTDYTINGGAAVTVGNFSSQANDCWLMSRDDDGTQRFSDGKLVYIKIWLASTLLRDMWAVPVGQTAQGAPSAALENGMWCAVTNQYYYNDPASGGSGVFTTEAIP